MKTPHKHAELIKAWADGAEIEARESDTHKWGKCSQPAWVDFYQYRIKPEPRPNLEVYARVTNNGVNSSFGWTGFGEKSANIALTFDAETGFLKAAEVLK